MDREKIILKHPVDKKPESCDGNLGQVSRCQLHVYLNGFLF